MPENFSGPVTYDRNNAAGNEFPQSHDTKIETEIRQPLLQGAGSVFNRIAGPHAAPGVVYGVVVARLNLEVSLVDFEIGRRPARSVP